MSKITYVAKFVLTITMLAAQCNAMWQMWCRQRRAAIRYINTQLMMESGNTHHIQYTSKNANQGCREQRKTKTKKSRAWIRYFITCEILYNRYQLFARKMLHHIDWLIAKAENPCIRTAMYQINSGSLVSHPCLFGPKGQKCRCNAGLCMHKNI